MFVLFQGCLKLGAGRHFLNFFLFEVAYNGCGDIFLEIFFLNKLKIGKIGAGIPTI